MPYYSSPISSKPETASKILSAIDFTSTAAVTAGATAGNSKCQKIYHFPEDINGSEDINEFKKALKYQKDSEQDKHELLKAIFIEIYGNQGNIPLKIKDFLYESTDIDDEAAKQIFMVLDNTAGYNKEKSLSDDRLGHSGVDLACFGERFRHEFFRLRQHCFKEEIYIGKKGTNDIKLQCFSGTPHADLHDWKPTSGYKFQISASSFKNTLSADHRIKAYKLLISSYISALEDANNYVIDKSKNNELITKLQTNLNNTSQSLFGHHLELSKTDLRTIQEANCILKLAGARRAGKNLVLMPPGAFAPEGLKFDGRENKFSEFILEALRKMQDEYRPNDILINAENGVLIKQDGQSGHTTEINKFGLLKEMKIEYANLNPFKSLLGEDYLVDLCSANFPMSMFSFSISQGKIPDEKEKTAEESLRGTANRICCSDTIVEIFDGTRKVGETKMGLQTTFFDKKWLEQPLIKNSDKPQDQSSDFLTSLKSINANNFDDICNSIPAQKEDNKILLYLFLDDLEKETSLTDAAVTLQSKIKNKLQEKEIKEIKKKIQLHSLSESLNPPIYEGWGVSFNQADINVRKENEKVFLLVKIDKIFLNSKLEGVVKDDSIKIELNEQDINKLKTDGKFNVGKVARLIREQESLTIQKENTSIVTIEASKKSHFYKDQDNNYIGFSKSKNQEKAIKTAFQNLLKEPVVAEGGSARIPSSTPMPQSLGLGTGPRPGHRPSGHNGLI